MKRFLFLLLLVSTHASAGLITIQNAGFELPNIGGGSQDWSSITPPGWSDIPSGQVGLAFGATLIHDAAEARSGNQFLHFQVNNAFGNKRVLQNLSENLMFGNVYSASVWLGFGPNSTNATQTGSIRLTAGGQALATNTLTLSDNRSSKEWFLLTVYYTPTAADLMLGQTLGIELFRSSAGFSADFDDVSASYRSLQTISEPSLLFVLSLVLLILRYNQRKTPNIG